MAQQINFLADFQLSKPTDTAGERTFSGIAYSGGVITDHAWYSSVAFDLATTVAETPMSLLFNHDSSKVIGVIDSVFISNQIEITGRLFADIDETAKDIATKSDRGIKWQLSVGIFPNETAQLSGSNTINGNTFAGDITLLKQNRIREVSFVALGADDKTSANVFNAEPTKPEPTQEQNLMTPEEVKALQDENAALKAEVEKFKNDFAAAQKAQRETDIKTLFSAIGREYSEATAAPYFTFSAEQFALVSKELTETKKPVLPENLFSSQANNGIDTQQTQQPVINAQDIYNKMNAKGGF